MRIHRSSATESKNPMISALSEIGRIGLGMVDKTNPDKPHPKSTDYFVARGDFEANFIALYGEKPTSLPIRFYTDDLNFSCQERLELRDGAGKLYGVGDGIVFNFFSQKTNSFSHQVHTTQRPFIAKEAEAFLRKGLSPFKAKTIYWRETLYLRFILADFPITGYWQLCIHGKKTSIPVIRDTVDIWQHQLKSIQNVPFLLTIRKAKSDNTGDSKVYPIVNLLPNFSLEAGLRIASYLHSNPQLTPQAILYKHFVSGVSLTAQSQLAAPDQEASEGL